MTDPKHVSEDPEHCVFCGTHCDFMRTCDGVCIPCGDRLQSIGLFITAKPKEVKSDH